MFSELKHSVMLKKADYAPKYAGIMGLCLEVNLSTKYRQNKYIGNDYTVLVIMYRGSM